MKKTYLNKLLIVIAIGILIVAACKKSKNPTTEPEVINKAPEVIINNSAITLAARVTYPGSDIAVLKIGDNGKTVNSREDFSQYNLQLIAEVAAPTYQSKVLQATSIDVVGTKVYVSYNTKGDTYLGGVDVFDINDESHPVLVSQAIMPNTDISSIVYNDNNVYLASATDMDKDGTLTSPAVLDKITLSNGLLSSTTARVQLKGFVGKNLLFKNGKIYTASSAEGGIAMINPSTFKAEKFVAINNSESLTTNASGSSIFVLKDKAAQILSLNPTDLSTTNTITLGGNLPQTAASVESLNTNFLYASGPDGLKYLSSTGAVIDNLPVPTGLTGVDVADIVTNNVSINNSLFYIANGAAGLYVAKLDGSTLVLLGKVAMTGSSNFVKSSGNLIFVATGTGGLRILKITSKATSSSTVACSGRQTLATDLNNFRNLNSGIKEYFTGSTILKGLNVNDNAIFDFCGSLVLNSTSNINSNGAFLVNGSLLSQQQLNINGFTELVGSFTINNTLTVNSNGKLKLIPTAASGEIYTVGGDFNVNALAEVNNSTLQLNNKLSINSSGRLRLVNTNLIVNGDFDLNGTIEFVGNCNVIVKGRYTKNSSGVLIGSNTGKVL